mmetsp:Transcript_5913/g.5318  ORF Transcript_5913/g.5318 Transcript_5913/m.5318 type:complete len:436 (+) Transcript_5913:557-1864(+)
MEVPHQEDVPVLLQLLDQHLRVINGGVELSGRVDPAPVEVYSRQVAPGTAIDDPIRIQHWDDLENKVVSQNLGIQRRSRQIIKDAFHHPGGAAFARVDPGGEDDPLAVLDGIRVALESSHNDHIAVVPGNCLAEGPPAHPAFPFGVAFDLVEVPGEVRVGVRIAVRQVHHIIVMFKLNAEGEGVVVAGVLPFHRVLVVADVSARPVPPSPRLLGLMLRIRYRPHPMVVQGVRLHQVNDVEVVGLVGFSVRDPEVVPLGVPAGVVVWLQDQIVLKLIHLNGSAEVAGLEPALEDEGVVVGALHLVEGRHLPLRRLHPLRVRRRVHTIKHHSVHEVFLVGDSFCFPPEGLFEDELLRRVQGLKIIRLLQVERRIPHHLAVRPCLDGDVGVCVLGHAFVGVLAAHGDLHGDPILGHGHLLGHLFLLLALPRLIKLIRV